MVNNYFEITNGIITSFYFFVIWQFDAYFQTGYLRYKKFGHPERKPLQLYGYKAESRLLKYKQIPEIKPWDWVTLDSS